MLSSGGNSCNHFTMWYNIYDFYHDEEWLEDLTLLKNDEVVFASCTHEEFCYIDKQ